METMNLFSALASASAAAETISATPFMLWGSVIVFLVAYAFIATEKINRVAVVSAGAAAMILLGATGADEAFYSHETGIDWNVIYRTLVALDGVPAGGGGAHLGVTYLFPT